MENSKGLRYCHKCNRHRDKSMFIYTPVPDQSATSVCQECSREIDAGRAVAYLREPELVEIAARWEAICELLDGKEVSDFMLSFPEVHQVSDMVGYGGIK